MAEDCGDTTNHGCCGDGKGFLEYVHTLSHPWDVLPYPGKNVCRGLVTSCYLICTCSCFMVGLRIRNIEVEGHVYK
jgi:hypothetical protein